MYATTPVISLGRTLIQDLYSSTPLAATFIPTAVSATDSSSLRSAGEAVKSSVFLPAPTTEEITEYFNRITPLKYSQPLQPNASSFSPPLEGLALTAYNSGHTLGGAIWHIQHAMESIVYAVDWNQARENVMGGAAWFGGIGGSEVMEQLRKPTALICDCKGGTRDAEPGGRQRRDDLFLTHIRSSLAKNGTVLVPCDTSARVLELAYILEQACQDAPEDVLGMSRVYLASKTAAATIRHTRSLLEWMDDSIVRGFEGEDESVSRGHKRTSSRQANGQSSKTSRPFEFRHIRMLERKSQVDRALKGEGPRVILASDLSLDWGFSKVALQEIAQKAENLILLTQRPQTTEAEIQLASRSTSRSLWQWFTERQDGVAVEASSTGEHIEQVHTGGRSLTIVNTQRAPLDGNDLQLYQQYTATQRQLQSSLQSRDETGTDMAVAGEDDSSSSSSDDSDEEHQGRTLNVTAAIGHASKNRAGLSDQDLGVNVLLRKREVHDFDVRNKKGRNAVFPYVQSRRRGDDFGDFIKPEAFVRAEEKGLDADSATLDPESKVGQKRKWDATVKTGGSRRQRTAKGRRVNSDDIENNDAAVDGPDGAAASDDSDVEPEIDEFQGPSKADYTAVSIDVHSRLAFVDFSGIHDRRSLQMLIPLIRPRKLILIGGTLEETESLARDCRSLLAAKEGNESQDSLVDVYTPVVNDTCDASVDTNAWTVKLSQDLVRRLVWQNVRNVGVVALTGQLKGEEPHNEEGEAVSARKKRQKYIKSESQEEARSSPESAHDIESISPVLDIVPPSVAAATRSVTQSLHVGDLRLADLRRLMQAAGHAAEFRGEGTLVIDGFIAVRKLGTGRIVVEGAPLSTLDAISGGHLAVGRNGATFYQVKRRIYEGLAVVAGA